MDTTSSKNKILTRIRQALKTPVPVPFPGTEDRSNLFTASQEEPAFVFAQNFTQLQGRFSYCENEPELVKQLQALFEARKYSAIYCREEPLKEGLKSAGLEMDYSDNLSNCHASVTGCEKLVARTGSILMSSAQPSGRTVSVYAPVHICIAYTDQLVFDISEGISFMNEKYKTLPSLITLATGPSRTADIEKTLVVGVHGPKEVFCFLVER
ncbi:MAG: lactate utilization protein [Chitinophagaceae bacterium]|nr:lactate utilization protein [Chitinophagaceae bacterium]